MVGRRKKPHFFYRLLGRFIIVVGFIGVFLSFLYLPIFIEWIRSGDSLNVLIFVETFDQEVVERFEEKYGVTVNLTYVEIDDEIYAKFRLNEGEGYDVVNISDFFVHMLKNQGVLYELDKDKIKNINSVYKRLLNLNFDPENRYSVPHKWYTYGLVYDKEFFKIPPDQMSLEFIFTDPCSLVKEKLVPSPFRLCMLEDNRDAICMASLYLFGGVEEFSDEDLAKLKKLLIKQKQWVESYTLESIHYFLFSGIVPIAITSSNFIRRIWEHSDRFEFSIPMEGSLLIVESLVIPERSQNKELAHKFINFMLEDEIAKINSMECSFVSANKNANASIDPKFLSHTHFLPDEQVFKRLHIPLLSLSSYQKIEETWLEVGFA